MNSSDHAIPTPIEERRAFGLHPKILLTIMREQAGSLSKALAELVMNSVDAGATRIDLTIGEESFVLADDGCGFTTRDQLESFFDIFGTPHEDGDAYYGRFRIGRGQIMSYAKTTWRSGPFEMRVDVAGNACHLGYDLLTHAETFPGCQVAGKFYESNRVYGSYYDTELPEWGIHDDFLRLVRYVPIPVFVNGRQANKLPTEESWDHEDENAWYRFVKDGHTTLGVYNRGVLVQYLDASRFGTGGIVVSKQPFITNMARNAVVEHRCPVWNAVKALMLERFELRLTKAKKLDHDEAATLMNTLLFGEEWISYQTQQQIRKIHFIPNIFGELKTPNDFLASRFYTLHDGKHTMIAERVQRQGRAAVVIRSMFARTRLDTEEPANYFRAVRKLREQLGMGLDAQWIEFADLVKELNDTSKIVEDSDLKEEEQIVLGALRYLNDRSFGYQFAGGHDKRRKIVAGESDTLQAWTDGTSFIAIDRKQILAIRNSGAAKLILLIAHEYGHDVPSTDEHAHDFAFYHRFHESVLSCATGDMADLLFRRYVSGICKAGIVPSSATGQHVRHIGECVLRLKSRIKSKADAHGDLQHYV
jgi:hypothetical protein